MPGEMNRSAAVEDRPNFLFALIGFFIPLAGLIMFLVMREQTPRRASSAGKGALWGFCIQTVTVLIVFVALPIYFMTTVVKESRDTLSASANSTANSGWKDEGPANSATMAMSKKAEDRIKPLFDAILSSDAVKVKALLKRDPGLATATDSFGSTGLHKVASFGSKEIAVILIEAGADVNTKDKMGETALKQAEFFHNDEVAAVLRNAAAKGAKKGAPSKG